MAFMNKFDVAIWPELPLLGIIVSLLTNRGVLYHILAEKQEKSKKMSVTSYCLFHILFYTCEKYYLLISDLNWKHDFTKNAFNSIIYIKAIPIDKET